MTTTINFYKDLPPIKNERLKISSSSPFTPTFVQAHLARSTNLNPAGLYASRVQDRRIALDNPQRESPAKKERDEKRVRRKAARTREKLGVIGRREAHVKGVWRLDTKQAKYHSFVPLHDLWLGYVSELLGLAPLPSPPPTRHIMPNSAGMHAKLVKADFHGSIMTVKQSKNPCLVGLSGIVIHETENAFRVITTKDQVKLIPKQNSIFTFRVPLYAHLPSIPQASGPATVPSTSPLSPAPDPYPQESSNAPEMQFELYGNQFRFRAAERAGRKFKHKESIEL